MNNEKEGNSSFSNKAKSVQVKLTNNILNKLNNYDLDTYINDIKKIGIEKTWNYICEYVMKYNNNDFLSIDRFRRTIRNWLSNSR